MNYNQSTRGRVADINRGLRVDRPTNVSPLASGAIFTIAGGRVQINLLIGEVTTNIQAQATTIRVISTPTVGVAYNLSAAATDLTGQLVGILLGITGTAAGNVLMGNGLAPAQADPVIVSEGVITITYGAASTGAIKWSIYYIPLDKGAYVTAA